MSYKNGDLTQWYRSRVGKKISNLEKKMLTPIVNHFKPFRCLELASSSLISIDLVKEKINLAREFDGTETDVGLCVVSDFSSLPFSSESFDLIVCSHVHETCRYSGQIISEISRVLMPEGLVVFFGLNPYGMWRRNDVLKKSQWWNHPLTRKDLMDLASVFSLDEVYSEYFGCGFLDLKSVSGVEKIFEYCRKRWVPKSSLLYKTVVKKNVLASGSPLLVENAVFENMS